MGFSAGLAPQTGLLKRSQEHQQQHKTRNRSTGLVQTQHSSPSLARQLVPQGHTCSINENSAICFSAKAEALHLLKKEPAWPLRREEVYRLHPALDASLCRAIPQAHLIFQDTHWKLTVLIQYLPYQSLVHPPFNLPANTVQNEGLNR